MRNLKTTPMIRGIGFYYDSQKGEPPLPNYDEIEHMVREAAFYRSQRHGPGLENDDWLKAEDELFRRREGGYEVFACDMSRKENTGFFRHFEVFRITPRGANKLRITSNGVEVLPE